VPRHDQLPDWSTEPTSEFKRNVRQLAKKYRRIQHDIQPIIDVIVRGSAPGDRISGSTYDVYKVRVRNTDRARGKSGGYRIIYQITPENTVLLITLYSKTEQADIEPHEIQDIIQQYDQEQHADDSESEPETADPPPPPE
jgi:mRNA-degrading endonuclease RelE of RelBE toxin-antitoxin system